MKKYSIYKDEILKFQWDSTTGDETYYEPCFGEPGSYSVVIEDITALLVQEKQKSEALKYLSETDWYVVRKAETAKEIPEEILKLRAEARLKI